MKVPIRINIFNMSASASDYYRKFLPVKHCAGILKDEGIELQLIGKITEENMSDVYVFNRIFSCDLLPNLVQLKRFGKRIVWDVDDLLTDIPERNPAREFCTPATINGFALCVEMSDYLSVSTETLGEAMRLRLGLEKEKIAVLPNLIDLDDWVRPDPRSGKRFTEVLWAGSNTHIDDLEMIREAIIEVSKTVHKCHFTFLGQIDKMVAKALSDPMKCTELTFCPLKSYPMMLRMIAPDIALCPLVDHEFNRCKSAIKWMEMSMAGAHVLASNIEPYSSVIDNYATGRLCDPHEWTKILRESVEYASDISPQGFVATIKAREEIRDKHCWQSPSIGKWLDYFRAIAG